MQRGDGGFGREAAALNHDETALSEKWVKGEHAPMVRIFVGVTHKPWFDYLAGLALSEVNFWQPSGTASSKRFGPEICFSSS